MMRCTVLVVVMALLAGCGSGGGGGAAGSVGSTAAGLDFSTEVPSVQTVLYAVEFTVRLPAGVTVEAEATGEVAKGRLLVKDAAATASGFYTPASGGAPASVRVNIADPNGFAAGELASLTCRDGSGGGGAYSVEGFSARDQNGAVLTGASLRYSVRKW